MNRNRCPWCTDPNAEDYSADLCRTHEAEYLGETARTFGRKFAEWVAA